MNLGIMRRFATAGVLVTAAGALAVATAGGAAGASQPQPSASEPAHSASAPHRQIGTAELTYFKVVLTATRGTGQPPTATVTAAGYDVDRGWEVGGRHRFAMLGGRLEKRGHR